MRKGAVSSSILVLFVLVTIAESEEGREMKTEGGTCVDFSQESCYDQVWSDQVNISTLIVLDSQHLIKYFHQQSRLCKHYYMRIRTTTRREQGFYASML